MDFDSLYQRWYAERIKSPYYAEKPKLLTQAAFFDFLDAVVDEMINEFTDFEDIIGDLFTFDEFEYLRFNYPPPYRGVHSFWPNRRTTV